MHEHKAHTGVRREMGEELAERLKPAGRSPDTHDWKARPRAPRRGGLRGRFLGCHGGTSLWVVSPWSTRERMYQHDKASAESLPANGTSVCYRTPPGRVRRVQGNLTATASRTGVPWAASAVSPVLMLTQTLRQYQKAVKDGSLGWGRFKMGAFTRDLFCKWPRIVFRARIGAALADNLQPPDYMIGNDGRRRCFGPTSRIFCRSRWLSSGGCRVPTPVTPQARRPT